MKEIRESKEKDLTEAMYHGKISPIFREFKSIPEYIQTYQEYEVWYLFQKGI